MSVFEMQGVHVKFKQGTPNEVHALRGVDLRLEGGGLTTIVGSNGAGKSTLTNVIAASIRPTSGTVMWDGKVVNREPDYRRARRVARVFADPLAGTVGDMSIEDNIALSMARGRRRTLSFAMTHGRRAKMRAMVAELGLDLEHRLSEDVGRLSSGQRQSLTLAMAIATEPDILILDEHLAALDPVTRGRLVDLTMRAAESVGCATVMVTHSMEEALRLGDSLLVMGAGQILARFDGAEKATMSVETLVAKIANVGVELSDRSLLAAAAPGENAPHGA